MNIKIAKNDYLDFLKSKIEIAPDSGFSVDDSEINPNCLPHVRDSIKWLIRGGRRALFSSFGMQKTVTQLETLRIIGKHEGGKALIVAPLNVVDEFFSDAKDRLDNLPIEYIKNQHEADSASSQIVITNYERVRDGDIDPTKFTATTLDEAAVLRSFGSKTYQEFLTRFKGVPYKFVATATPSPNKFKELIHYAGYLEIMDTGQALTRFFHRDSTQANNLTLYPHKEKEFWFWLSTWALFLTKPSDINPAYSDAGFDMPPLEVIYHEVPVDHSTAGIEDDGQEKLFRDAAIGLKDAAREKRDSIDSRVSEMMKIVNAEPDKHFILWHDLEAERHAIKKALPEAEEVFGSQDIEENTRITRRFKTGGSKYLATKPDISAQGGNLQYHCHEEIFIGIGYKFNDFIQAIHRVYRFGQQKPVRIHVIYAESERAVLDELKRKWMQYDYLVDQMVQIIRKYGLNSTNIMEKLARTMGVTREETVGKHFTAVFNDNVPEMARLADNSVDLIHTSIPFSNHYEYTPTYNDFGHNEDNDRFFEQMDYLTPELLRVLKPGRVAAIHVKDRILFGNATGTGMPTVDPFSDETRAHFCKHGFQYMGRITVVTDVVRENAQTYRLGWTEQCKDGSKMGVGCEEYILIFRKLPTDTSRAYADTMVTKSKDNYPRSRWQIDAHGFWRSSGDRLLSIKELEESNVSDLQAKYRKFSRENVYDYHEHIDLAEELDEDDKLPASFMVVAPGSWAPNVWDDINRMRTLNGDQARKDLTMHICLARDSLVLTRRGFIPIQDVRVGDLALTHKGRWRSVQVVANTGVRPVVALRAQGVAALMLTPDHKMWTRKSGWKRARDGAERADPTWIRADETIGGYVNLKLPPVEESKLTEQECWLIGRWLADGHVGSRGDFYVSIGRKKLAEFERMAGAHAGTMAERTAMQFRLKGLNADMIDALSRCGHGAASKQVPIELLALPTKKARALLDGYLSGDGHFVAARGTWMATSISRSLLLGVAMLAQRVYGAIGNLRSGRAPGHTVIDGREVQTRQEWILSFDIPGARRKSPFVLNDGAWKKVRSAEPAGEVETWCLRVADDESFTAEGCIVKNCPLQFDIVERIIERYSNPGELVLDPFGGLMTVPYMAVKMGRRGYGIELNHESYHDGVQYLKAADIEASAPTLFEAMEVTA